MIHWLILINVTVTTFMGIFSAAATVIANGCIQGELALTDPETQWVTIFYLLGINTMVPAAAWLAGRFGFKTMYAVGVLLFVMGSGFSGLAYSFSVLGTARFVEGVGAGIVFPVGLALIAQNFPKERFVFATNLYIGAGFAGGLGLGIPIAGYLSQFVSWRVIFLTMIPVGILAFIACWLVHKETKKDEKTPFDLWGYLLFVTFVATLLTALTFGPILSTAEGWRSPWIISAFILSGFMLIGTVFIEMRHPNPILPLTLFKNPVFSVSILALFLIGTSFFGSVSLITDYMINALRYERYMTGKIAMIYGCTIGVFSILCSYLMKKIPVPFFTIGGLSLVVASFFLNNILDWQTGPTQVLWVLFLRGMGMGLAIGPTTTQAISSVAPELRNSAAILLTFFRQLGGTYGGSVLALVSIRRAIFYTEHFSEQMSRQVTGYKVTYQKLATHLSRLNGEAGPEQARRLLDDHLKNQAYIQGLNDAFFFIGFVGSAIVLILLFLSLKQWWKSKKSVVGAI